MTKEELNTIIASMMEDKVKALGHEVTAQMKDEIEKRCEEIMKGIETRFPKTDPAADRKSGFKDFWEFAKAVQVADSSRGHNVDDRLKALMKAAGSPSVTEGNDEYMGYIIPEEFRTTLLEIAVKKSNVMQMAMTVPMATNSVHIPYIDDFDHSGGLVHGAIEFKWLDEEGEKVSTRPKVGKIQLRLKKCAGLCYVSDELLQDSPISMEPLLTRLFTDALAWQLDYVFINGSGAGQPLGILNAPCLVTINKETGQEAKTIYYENIIKMYARMWDKSGAIFMANDDIFPQLATMSLAVGTGGAPVYLPANGASGKPYDTLMGKPLMFSEHCQTLGTKGDIYFCDWSQYLVGQKAGAGMQFATSIHLKFDYDQTAFRFVFRVDGQPWWATYQKPRHGTDYKSPFVCIETRS